MVDGRGLDGGWLESKHITNNPQCRAGEAWRGNQQQTQQAHPIKHKTKKGILWALPLRVD